MHYIYTVQCAKHMAFKHNGIDFRGANSKYKGIMVSYRKAIHKLMP